MRYLVLPVLFVLFGATPYAHAQGLADFKSFSRAIGKEVSIVDRSGLINEGVLEAVTVDAVTLRVGSATQSFPRAEIASAERMKDQRLDGAAMGAVVGFALAFLTSAECSTCPLWHSAVGGAAAGFLIDAAESNREPLYRASPASAPTLRVSWRF